LAIERFDDATPDQPSRQAHFFLDLFPKISEKSGHRNRGGLYSYMNTMPAAFEITGTLTVSAGAESLGASIAV
jgi:hypothetical protein